MRSNAFSCLGLLGSCFAIELYSSSVRLKAVSDADSAPRDAGVSDDGESAGVGPPSEARSFLMDWLCLSAELNVVFCG